MHKDDAVMVLRMAHGRTLSLDRVRIMGVLNVTPDSFSDGGLYASPAAALDRAKRLVDEGAAWLDVGGESTRPGSARVSAEEQCRRVLPVIEAIRGTRIDVPISVDTTRSAVAARAIEAGADVVNDVSGGLEDAELLGVTAAGGAAVILMHRLVEPEADSYSDRYASAPDYAQAAGGDAEAARAAGVDPVVPAVRRFLVERAAAARAAGVNAEAIVLDPGLGFGKSVGQNFALLAAMGREGALGLAGIGSPLLGAASRKSFLGKAAGVEQPSERVHASVTAAVVMALAGVRLIRAHDVAAHREGLAVAEAAMERAI